MRHRIFVGSVIALVFSVGAAAAQYGGPRAMVESWYRQYLGRDADPIGLHDHIQALERGTPPLLVQAAILGSAEYYRLNGANPEGFIVGLYRDVLRRPPTPAEMDVWLRRAARESRSDLATRFLRELRVAAPPPYLPYR